MAAPTDILITAVTSDGATPTIAENSANSTNIGTFDVADTDKTTYTYALLDSAGGRFSITGNTLKVANGLLLDYETQLDYTITVRVTESGQTFDKSFVIRLTDVVNEAITGSGSADTLQGGSGNDNFNGAAGNDLLDSGGGNDTLDGGTGADTMLGGTGDDIYYVDDAGDVVQDGTIATASGHDKVYSSINFDLSAVFTFTVDTTTVKYSAATVDDLTLTGSALNATGNSASNIIVGNANANRIDGKVGMDTMRGGAGNDTFVVDSTADVVEENAGEGTDTIETSVTYSLTAGVSENPREVENLVLSNTVTLKNFDGTGNALANTITGNDGANALDGKGGADTLIGGNGNDSYTADNSGDVVSETSSTGGTDWVYASLSFTLGDNVEKLTLTGSSSINGTGNTLANAITGNDLANLIDGGTGKDTMAGAKGNDTYVLDVATDVVQEVIDEGIDTIRYTGTLSLGGFLNIENLELQGSGAADATGNTLDNKLTGTDGANKLDGGSGADTMIGYGGDDTYVVDAVGDVVTEGVGAGTDLVQSSVSFSLAVAGSANIENLTLTGAANLNATGNGNANVITGNGGANVIDSGGGADTMDGKAGDDVYVVDSASDVVTELDGMGRDTIRTSLSYSLSTLLGIGGTGYVENLVLTGTAVSATGNALNNGLTGNASANVLDGGVGIDTMAGGLGDDTYYVDNAADVISEALSGGTDTVYSTVSYALVPTALQPQRAVERLYLTGTATANATGNALDNVIGGNQAANKLNGGTGSDTMAGGAGNDTYYVDNAGDAVTENANEGTDIIISTGAIGIDLSALGNIENGWASGSGASLTGNSLNNVLTGNAAANTFDGGSGADTMAGGAGNDTYIVDSAGDLVKENLSAGTDQVDASISYTLAANVDKLVLTGTAAINATGNTTNNVLVGNTAANWLDGKGGNDTMSGGLGNDVYVVDSAGDVVDETGGGGTDWVRSAISYTLGADVEKLTLLAATSVNGTGNAANNLINGGAGANVIDGGAGTDTMAGGNGNDTYIVDTAADVISELATGGLDLVRSSVTYSLAAASNVEYLTLTGTGNINGTGNNIANALTGNSGNNVLSGADGGDTLYGALGNDTLTGGLGNDTFVFDTALNAVSNVDRITDFNVVDDKIHLKQSVFSAIPVTGSLSTTSFRVGTAAANASDRIIYNSTTGDLFYDADGNGATAAVKFAILSAGLALTSSDFNVF